MRTEQYHWGSGHIKAPLSPACMTAIRFPFIRPDVPAVERWVHLLERAYRNRRFTNFGELSLELEGEMLRAWGSRDSCCVAVSSGTAAVALPLIARNVTGRVVIPAFTFAATLSAVRMAGAEPVLVDVSPNDWRVTASALDHAMRTTGSRAAVMLSPFGLRTDFSPHAALVAGRGGTLVIDSAAGLGVARDCVERHDHCFEAYSMHATKSFAVGEGGIVFGHRSTEIALRRAANFGLMPGSPRDLAGWGINAKLSELHAAVGVAAALGYGERLARRRALVSSYINALAPLGSLAMCTDPSAGAWQSFPLLLPSSDAAAQFSDAAASLGVETRRYYDPSLSILSDVERVGPCPASEDLARRMCCVPVYADTTEAEGEELVSIVRRAAEAALGVVHSACG